MVFAGRGSQELGCRIAEKLGVSLGGVELKTFSNGEVYCRYLESIRGADVFIVQSTHAPVNRNLMELLLMIDAAKGASAHRIIAVTPWYGYSRQDKKSLPREPISARLVARMLETAGADRVLTMHLHAGQVQGFFQIPVDHLIARPMLTQYFIDKVSDDEWVAVSPDAGRAKLAEKFAGELGVRPAFLTKDRPEHNIAEAGYVIGDVEGKAAILVDDMIDTAGTLVEAARVLRESGATRVFAAATHGVFSGPAFERLRGLGDRGDRRHRHDPAAAARAGQDQDAERGRHPRPLDPLDLHRRLRVGAVRRREPAVLGPRSRARRRDGRLDDPPVPSAERGPVQLTGLRDVTAPRRARAAIWSTADAGIGPAPAVRAAAIDGRSPTDLLDGGTCPARCAGQRRRSARRSVGGPRLPIA